MWRMVRAGDCQIQCQGTMYHLPKGVELDPSIKPERIQGGRFMLPRYPQVDRAAWILQRWFGPWVWGTATEWTGHRTREGDARMMVQEFPAGGDYFMVVGPWNSIEEAGDLAGAINLYWRRELSKPKDVEAHIRQMMAEEVADRQDRLERLEREMNAHSVAMETIWKSTSAGAQQVRELMAAGAGIEGHLGASEDWG